MSGRSQSVERTPTSRRRQVRKKSILLAFLALFRSALALTAAGCGGDDGGGGGEATQAEEGGGGGGGAVEELPSASCEGLEFEGEGEPDVLIASDLPLQGSSRTQTVQMVEAIREIGR